MRLGWWVRLRSIWYSLALHVIAAALLVFSFSFTEIIKPPHQDISIVNAIVVDKSQVDKELQRLKQEEEKKILEEQQRLDKLEKKAAEEKKKSEDLKKQRLEEEKKLLEAQKKKEQEQKLREEEQKKLVQLEKEKQELEKQRKLEEEKKTQAEAERKKAEEEQKKKAAELEEERKKAEAEKALQAQLDAEAAEEQLQQDITLQQKIIAEIASQVKRNFNQTGLPPGLKCKVNIRLLPGGDVINVNVVQSSGNDIFDRRALTAVQKSSPFSSVPEDLETFERIKIRDITFTFEP
jgi:colicin import membrane protein